MVQLTSIKLHTNSFYSSMSYRVGKALVDVGNSWEGFEGVESVLLTHAHFDHIYGLNRLMETSPSAKIYTNEYGRMMLLDAKRNLSRYNDSPFVFTSPENIVCVDDGDEIPISSGLTAKAVFTPGHSPSCITWIVGDALFTGDSYIPGIKTITNLPGGDKEKARLSEQLILRLAESRTIYPGHSIDDV